MTMMRQGSCANPMADAFAILDRLAGLSKIISPEVMEQALRETGRSGQRTCRLSHRVMLWVVLAMGVLTDLPIRQVFKHARRMQQADKTPSRSNLCEARQRLGVAPVQRVFELVVKPLATPQTPGAFYHGMRLMGIDGTVLDVPDTPANEKRFGRSSGGRGDSAFPQVRKISLVELGTHIEVAMAVGGYHDSEQKLVECLWDHLATDTLLLEDRGFFSYKHWKRLNARGIKLLVRVKGNLILQPTQRLSDGSFLAKIYPSPQDRAKDRDGIVVRVIEYTLDDPERTGHGETHRLVTNLLDPSRFPALELACSYHERWEEELVFDEQKTHQDPRRPTKPTHLRSQTPEGVEQELYALSLGHFVVRALMLEAAQRANLDVDRLSFTGCLQILQARLPECDSTTPARLDRWYELLLEELAQERLEPRRNRINPRVVKRKMSKFAKKRPEHRGRPCLTKPFAETVIIT
jgi:Insertion element 4 transposase N-terminal/Transposase DDE domain